MPTAGSISDQVATVVHSRPPKIGHMKEEKTRRIAPEMPGSAASQNSWSVVNGKPTEGSLATTTDHTCQTAKESSSAGIEHHRLRRAILRPLVSQKVVSS